MESELHERAGLLTIGEFLVKGDFAWQEKPRTRRQCDGSGYWGWQCVRCPKKEGKGMSEVKEYMYAAQANAKVDELAFTVAFLVSRCRFLVDGTCKMNFDCPAHAICQEHALAGVLA